MPLPFHPDDFPINEDAQVKPKRVFFLKGAIHFKQDAHILDLSGKTRQRFNDFSNAFCEEVSKAAKKAQEGGTPADYTIGSIGDMMRTIKTVKDSDGEKVCDLNITFISFDCSTVRFPPDSPHSRHEVELWPVKDGEGREHECFVRHSIPFFWDMSSGPVGVLYKVWNQERVEIGKVAAYGFQKDAILVLDDAELDPVVALSTCVILLNGRNAMDA